MPPFASWPFTKIKSATVYGGVGFAPQSTRCARAPTSSSPAPVACWITRGRATLGRLEILVPDRGRPDGRHGLSPVRQVELTPQRRQTTCPATFAEELNRLASRSSPTPSGSSRASRTGDHHASYAAAGTPSIAKMELLLKLLDERWRAVLIFTRTVIGRIASRHRSS